MHATETRAIVTLSRLAAFVDGEKHERERTEIKRIAEGLSPADGMNLPSRYQDVLLKRVSLDSVAAALGSAESKQRAYEMAVCVCDADGVQSVAEQRFLARVQQTLGLAPAAAAQFVPQADALASAPVGVGLTSQYLEQAGRKLLGGLLRGLGQQAVRTGMGFAATYALGHVAKRYYAGGRTLSTQVFKEAYASGAQAAQGLHGRYLPAMQEATRTLDAGKVLAVVRGV